MFNYDITLGIPYKQDNTCLPSHAGPSGSLFPPDHLFEVELTLRGHNRQLILQMVRDKVAYALK